MRYNTLHELLGGSRGARRYFLSLPVERQLELHAHDAYIHTLAELHRRADAVEATRRQCALGGWRDPPV